MPEHVPPHQAPSEHAPSDRARAEHGQLEHAQPEHAPRRPDWTCRDCREPWPCPTRQAMLLDECREQPVAVVLYLAGCYQEASIHLAALGADVIYDRIFGWFGARSR